MTLLLLSRILKMAPQLAGNGLHLQPCLGRFRYAFLQSGHEQCVFNLVSHYLFRYIIIFNYSAIKWFSLYTKNKESQNIKRLPMR